MLARSLLPALVATSCTYQPGSFQFSGPHLAGQRATAGCLDVTIARRPDLETSAVLEYRFGNRCSRAAVVDLAAVQVVGRTASGREVRLAAYDPGHELVALALGGRADGGEALAYPANEPLAQVCVDAASLARAREPRWLCFARLDQSGEPAPGREPAPITAPAPAITARAADPALDVEVAP